MRYQDYILEITKNFLKLSNHLDTVRDRLAHDQTQLDGLQKVQTNLTDAAMTLALMEESLSIENANIEID